MGNSKNENEHRFWPFSGDKQYVKGGQQNLGNSGTQNTLYKNRNLR